MSRPWQPGGAFLMQIPHASTPPPRQARFGPGYGLKPSTPQRPGIKPGLDGNQVLGAPFYPVMNPPSAHPSAQTEFMRKSLKSSPTKESSLNDAIEPNVYKRSGFEERPIAEWQRERAVGHPSKRLGRYTRHASNRSWLEVDLEWQQSMKNKARELNIRPYSLTTTANFSNRPPDVDGWTASAVGDGEDDEGYTSASYDYEGEGLPPSPFSPRVSPRASKTAPTGGSPSPNASPSASPSRGGSPETSPSRLSIWEGESSVLLRSPTSTSSIFSRPGSRSVCALSRTQSASSFGTPRPWHAQPTTYCGGQVNTLRRRYGNVKAFGSSPTRFPKARSETVTTGGAICTARGGYDGSTAHLHGCSGIWSFP